MRLILAILAALLVSPASAQVKQSGYVTPGHAVYWVTNGVVGDGGTAANGFLPSLGVTASGPGICQNSGSPAAGGYNQLCFAPTSTGGGFTWNNYNGATGVPSMNINGTVYPFPFSVSPGGVIGPSTTTIGCAAPWANATGTLLGNNCGLSLSSAGTATFAPTTSTLNPGIVLNQTIVGSSAADFYANPLTLNFGALNAAGHNVYGFGPTCNANSASFQGQLFCGYDYLNVTAIGTPGFPNDIYVDHFSLAIGSANTTDADASIFAGNDNVSVTGTGWSYIVGREIDVTATHAVTNKYGLRIVQSSTDAFAGTNDGAVDIFNQSGAVGWKDIIKLDATNNIMTSAGCVICATGTQTITTGLDLSAWTLTGNFLHSNAFSVDGSGNEKNLSLLVNGATIGFATAAVNGVVDTQGAGGGFEFDSRSTGHNWLWYDNGGIATLLDTTVGALLTIAPTTGNVGITGSVTVGGGSAITSSGAGGALGSNAFTSTAYAPLASPSFTGPASFGGQIVGTYGTPTIASGGCGATTNGTLASGATNQFGEVIIGAASTTSCTIAFSTTLGAAPLACILFPGNAQAGTELANDYVSAITTAHFVITGTALANTDYYYHCI